MFDNTPNQQAQPKTAGFCYIHWSEVPQVLGEDGPKHIRLVLDPENLMDGQLARGNDTGGNTLVCLDITTGKIGSVGGQKLSDYLTRSAEDGNLPQLVVVDTPTGETGQVIIRVNENYRFKITYVGGHSDMFPEDGDVIGYLADPRIKGGRIAIIVIDEDFADAEGTSFNDFMKLTSEEDGSPFFMSAIMQAIFVSRLIME